MLRPTVGSGLIISWAGMRGIVSLAAALALPSAFPYRDLIVLTAFSVVLGTLVIQGLTLKPLLRALDLHDDDPVGRELSAARERALRAGLASFEHDRSPVADAVRRGVHMQLGARRRLKPAIADARRRADNPSAAASGGPQRRFRHACQRRDRRRCVSSRWRRTWTGSKWQSAVIRSKPVRKSMYIPQTRKRCFCLDTGSREMREVPMKAAAASEAV